VIYCKEFSVKNGSDISNMINEWLKRYPNVKIVNVQYAISGTNTGYFMKSALIFYQKIDDTKELYNG